MKTKMFFITSIMLLFLVNTALTQVTLTDRPTFAVLGGFNLQNFNGKDYFGNKLDNDLVLGYNVGFNAQLPLVPSFYFQPGLMLTSKGTKSTTDLVTSRVNINYVEIPLNLVYKGVLGNGQMFIGFGPYMAFGYSGNVNYKTDAGSSKSAIEFKNPIVVGDSFSTPYYRRFDAGGNIFVGYEMASGLFLQLNTQLGMLKINPEDNRVPKGERNIKNTGFGMSAGFRF